MTNEIRTLRDARVNKPEDQGHVLFRLGALLANDAALAAELQQDAYADPALVPASPWLGKKAPATPRVASNTDGLFSLSVMPGDSMAVRWWLVQARGRDGSWITVLRPSSSNSLALDQFNRIEADEVAVRAVGPTGAISMPVVIEGPSH